MHAFEDGEKTSIILECCFCLGYTYHKNQWSIFGFEAELDPTQSLDQVTYSPGSSSAEEEPGAYLEYGKEG